MLRIHTHAHTRDRLASFGKEMEMNPSHSNLMLGHSNIKSTLLELIYIVKNALKKFKYFEYFLLIHQVGAK